MSDEFQTKPGTAFWIITGLLAVWNLNDNITSGTHELAKRLKQLGRIAGVFEDAARDDEIKVGRLVSRRFRDHPV